VISISQSSNCAAGRAFKAGIEPTTPALHCSITSLGLLMMNKGDAMTGNGSFARTGGNLDMESPQKVSVKYQNASSAMAVTLPAPSTMLSRSPGALDKMWSA